MYRPLLLMVIITLTASSTTTFADSGWVSAVLNHPNLRVPHSNIEKQQWNILEREAEKGFDLDISSSAHLPLIENFDSSFTRAVKHSPYLDLVFNASKTVYDFGEADALINSERSRQTRARLAFANDFEKQTHDLFSLIIQYKKANQALSLIQTAQANIGLVQRDLTRRFESGLGTITDIRRTQLNQLDLETQATQMLNKIDEVEHIISNNYGLDTANLVPIWDGIQQQFKRISHIDQQKLRSSAISHGAKESLRHQRDSIDAQKKPKLSLDVKATLYDVTRSISNYQMAGELRLNFPAYDSGYRAAKMASISHSISAEQQTLEQLIQQKSLDLKKNERQLNDLELQYEEGIKKRANLNLQLNNMKLSLGTTGNDHAGLAKLYIQIVATQMDLIDIISSTSQLSLDQILLGEQIIQQFNVPFEKLP
jgi:outer membrane protein TolC